MRKFEWLVVVSLILTVKLTTLLIKKITLQDVLHVSIPACITERDD